MTRQEFLAAATRAALACGGDPEGFARALAAHWATDPHYADKLLRVDRDNHLNELDSGSPDSKTPASSFKEQL